ncbi:Isochorismatase-like protein [Mycena amicta]|nr:Isochorismatase-like protein [Mycena amicta]
MEPASTLFLLCDLQERFRPAISGFEHVVAMTNKIAKVAKILSCEVLVTTQKAKALGPIDAAVELESLGPLLIGTFDKTLFSMLTSEVLSELTKQRPHIKSIVLLGIEAHVCILQTSLELLAHSNKYAVYVLADGVSSCNPAEVPIALAQMRASGVNVTSSESLSYQLVRDAGLGHFKAFSKVIKEEKEATSKAVDVLLGRL